MTADQHIAEAERLLAADKSVGKLTGSKAIAQRQHDLAVAQVHATLAIAKTREAGE